MAEAVIESRDCMSLVLPHATGKPAYVELVRNFASALDQNDRYGLDQFWLLLYTLFMADEIQNPYAGDQTFDLMKADGVRFIN